MFTVVKATPFESDAPVGARRAIIRRAPSDGKPELIELHWGLPPPQPGGRPFRFIPSEGRHFPSQRCLVPASEFHVRANGHRYRFKREDGNWFYLAGIWRQARTDWEASYAVLTVEANVEVARYQKRQGALIPRNRHMDWLDLTRPEEELLITPPARTFVIEEIRDDNDGQPMLTFE